MSALEHCAVAFGRIERVKFSACNVGDGSLSSLLRSAQPTLHALHLHNCRYISTLPSFAPNALQHISIAKCRDSVQDAGFVLAQGSTRLHALMLDWVGEGLLSCA